MGVLLLEALLYCLGVGGFKEFLRKKPEIAKRLYRKPVYFLKYANKTL
jgi:hypothetical protein